MTNDEINQAIAEKCGWTILAESPLIGVHLDARGSAAQQIPKYTEDLNAIHDAEKMLTFSDRIKYAKELQAALSVELRTGLLVSMEACIFATALQRATAFLKVFGVDVSGKERE